MFSVIRGKGGFRDNPDPQQFRAAFRQVLIDKLLVQSSFSNCKEDFDKIIVDFTTLSNTIQKQNKIKKEPSERFEDKDIPGLKLAEMIALPPSLPEKNTLAYIAGYLLRKSNILNCEFCNNAFSVGYLCSSYDLIRQKQYTNIDRLIHPSEIFLTFICNLEKKFNFLFSAVMHTNGIMSKLYSNSIGFAISRSAVRSPKCLPKRRRTSALPDGSPISPKQFSKMV